MTLVLEISKIQPEYNYEYYNVETYMKEQYGLINKMSGKVQRATHFCCSFTVICFV